VTDEVAARVQAADHAAVASAIPAGLPHDRLESVILVYSDLVSRRAAMQGFANAGDLPHLQPSTEMLSELANGHEAAQRFDADLDAARSLAAATPPITVAPADSREAAEVLLLVRYVDVANEGCDSRGGGVVTELPAIEWVHTDAEASPTGSETDGTIGGVEFTADLGPDGTWAVQLIAC